MSLTVVTQLPVIHVLPKTVIEKFAVSPFTLIVGSLKSVWVSLNWLEHEREFAEQCNAKLINLNCGHYVHYYESDLISIEIRNFVK